jgi:hypothetical protein
MQYITKTTITRKKNRTYVKGFKLILEVLTNKNAKGAMNKANLRSTIFQTNPISSAKIN